MKNVTIGLFSDQTLDCTLDEDDDGYSYGYFPYYTQMEFGGITTYIAMQDEVTNDQMTTLQGLFNNGLIACWAADNGYNSANYEQKLQEAYAQQ